MMSPEWRPGTLPPRAPQHLWPAFRRLVTVPPQGGQDRVNARKYPIFVRDGHQLVKIAWSKASKAEYEHKAPARVIGLLAAKITTLRSGGRLFSMEGLLPLRDRDGGEFPTY